MRRGLIDLRRQDWRDSMRLVQRWAHELKFEHLVFVVPGGEVVVYEGQRLLELCRGVLRTDK